MTLSLQIPYTVVSMRADVAIIGGTGTGERLAAMGGTPLFVPTPDGMLRGRCIGHQGFKVLVVSRHSSGHKVPPHSVRYAAFARALKRLGVKACLSTAAVGSLRPEWTPGTLVACSDFIDLSFRNLTLFQREVVHRDMSEPFAEEPRQMILDAAAELGLAVEPSGVYVNANGPRYETPHEIEAYRQLGGDLVGMTAGSEAILFREAEVPYACLAVVTNLAAGMAAAPLSHGEVVDVMRERGSQVVELLLEAARRLAAA